MKKVFFIIISFLLFSASQTIQAQSLEDLDDDKIEALLDDKYSRQIFELINDHRESIGLDRLIFNYDCQIVCLDHSMNMASGAVAFGHDGYDEREEWVTESIKEDFPDYFLRSSAENVAMNQSKNPKTVVQQWLKSPGHRKNIENPNLTHAGLIAYRNSRGNYYYTQFFIGLEDNNW